MNGVVAKEHEPLIVEAYLAGSSILNVAEQYGYGYKGCRSALLRCGVKLRKRGGEKVVHNKPAPQAYKGMIEAYQSGLSLKQAAAKFGYSKSASRSALLEAGIKPRNSRPAAVITKEQQASMIESYRAGASIGRAALEAGCGETACYSALRSQGVVLRTEKRHGRRYFFNESFFNDINTEEKAYFLGLVTADGCLFNTTLHLMLQRRDRHIIERFKLALETPVPIREYSKVVRLPNGNECISDTAALFVTSKKMAIDLRSLGVVPRKSLTVEPWSGCFGQLGSHYFRGLMDGDGYISKDRQGQWHLGLVGSEAIINAFCVWVKARCSTRGIPKKVGNIYTFRVGGNRIANDVLQALYGECTVALNRKLILATECIKCTNGVSGSSAKPRKTSHSFRQNSPCKHTAMGSI